MMRITHACLVVIDISGYTRFITQRTLALAHAEQIITDLINAVLDQARHPLVLNKLEGDAALMFRETAPGDATGAADVFGQVQSFFPAFREKLEFLRRQSVNCTCDACSNITELKLKAFVHTGEIVIKQIRQFEEIAGEPVILIHRMMKNSVALREYVLATGPAISSAGLPLESWSAHDEEIDGFGQSRLWLCDPAQLPAGTPPVLHPADRTRMVTSGVFRHLPE